jgi:hypothetical protein
MTPNTNINMMLALPTEARPVMKMLYFPGSKGGEWWAIPSSGMGCAHSSPLHGQHNWQLVHDTAMLDRACI